MKRGQIEGQTLMYALSAIIAVFLLLFGYQAIAKFQEQGQQVETFGFENTLKRSFSSVDYGTRFPVDMNIPPGFNKVCFVNNRFTPYTERDATAKAAREDDFNIANGNLGDTCESIPTLVSSVSRGANGVKKDVFLINADNQVAASYFVGNLEISTGSTLDNEALDIADPDCYNGRQDGTETGFNCGGPCDTCRQCFCVEPKGGRISIYLQGRGRTIEMREFIVDE